MGRKRIIDANACKFSLHISGENKQILDQLTENYACKYGPLINRIIDTLCHMPKTLKTTVENACLAEYHRLSIELDHTSDEFHHKNIENNRESYLNFLKLINGGDFEVSDAKKENLEMKKIKLFDGYLVCPKDWIITNPEEAEQCRYATLLECRNSSTYGVPHFVYLTNSSNSTKTHTAEFRKTFFDKCRKIWPKFSEIEELNRKNQLVPDPEDPGHYLNLDAYIASPIIGLFSIDEQGESLTDEYPYGAMIVRSQLVNK